MRAARLSPLTFLQLSTWRNGRHEVVSGGGGGGGCERTETDCEGKGSKALSKQRELTALERRHMTDKGRDDVWRPEEGKQEGKEGRQEKRAPRSTNSKTIENNNKQQNYFCPSFA